MNPQYRIESLIIQILDSDWIDASGPDFRRMRSENYIANLDVVIPYTWLLCTKGLPQARRTMRQGIAAMRQALNDLETLLNTIDAAEEEANAQGHPEWAPLIALVKTPFPLQKPETCDIRVRHNIAVMLRDTLFDGDWEKKIAWTKNQGSSQQRTDDLPFSRTLQEFEQRYGVNLTDLLFSERDRTQHEQLRKEHAQRHPKDLSSQ